MSLYLTLFNFISMYVPLNLALSPHRLFVVIYTFVVPIIDEATIKLSAHNKITKLSVNFNLVRN